MSGPRVSIVVVVVIFIVIFNTIFCHFCCRCCRIHCLIQYDCCWKRFQQQIRILYQGLKQIICISMHIKERTYVPNSQKYFLTHIIVYIVYFCFQQIFIVITSKLFQMVNWFPMEMEMHSGLLNLQHSESKNFQNSATSLKSITFYQWTTEPNLPNTEASVRYYSVRFGEIQKYRTESF